MIAIKQKVYNLMSEYEANYRRLMYLIPYCHVDKGSLKSDLDDLPELEIDILEKCKYTTTIALIHYLDVGSNLVPDLYMKLRVYRDARLVEVISYQNQTRFLPQYPYPNRKMRYPHEKRLVNLFLGEWLRYCIKNEYRFVSEADISSASWKAPA